jgi:enoyl-CoA hydratase/carnithine racemase
MGAPVKPDEFREVRYSVHENVATVALHRPERNNAWTGRMAAEYRWALATADGDDSVGAIVVTGAGKSFCVGADTAVLREVDQAGGEYRRAAIELPPYPDGTPAALRHNHTYPLALSKPVIAAINGPCAGAGFVLATYADLRFAAAGVKITASFAGLGLPAEYGIGWLLPRIVGVQSAAEILLANPVLTAEEARDLRFVSRVWPAEELAAQVHRFARGMARESAPASIRVMKRQLYADAESDLHTAYLASVRDMEQMMQEPDFRVGVAAVRQRTRPRYR